MASKSTRHAITVISTAQGVTQSIADSYPAGPPKTVNAMLSRIKKACGKCFDQWPEKIDAKDIKRIRKRIDAMEAVIAPGEKSEAVLLSSAIIMLLLDLRDRVHSEKRAAIDSLIAAYNRLNRYYDRRLDHWQAYHKAKQGVERLYSVEA
jgi:hypothetical protein